jgi:hypothetical protein
LVRDAQTILNKKYIKFRFKRNLWQITPYRKNAGHVLTARS